MNSPFLVIAKHVYDKDISGNITEPPMHFLVMAMNEGAAIFDVKTLLEKWRTAGKPAIAYQYTVKLVVEYQPNPSSQVFAL